MPARAHLSISVDLIACFGADMVVRLGELAQTYYFGHVKPSQRATREAEKHAGHAARHIWWSRFF
jgi:hypothetical protein